MNKGILAGAIAVLILGTTAETPGRSLEQKIVTRVDTVTVALKHHTLVITATGMGRTPTPMGRGGKLLRRASDRPLDKDGLVEYDLVFNAVPNYAGFKMQPIKTTLRDRSAPEGVKGVRVFSQYNQVDALIPPPKQKKSLLPFGKKHDKSADETTGAITGSSPHR